MGAAPSGTKQKTYYVREDHARVLAMLASRDGSTESQMVNEAFAYFLKSKLSVEELRMFGHKGTTDGDIKGSVGRSGTLASDEGRAGGKTTTAHGQPVPKNRTR